MTAVGRTGRMDIRRPVPSGCLRKRLLVPRLSAFPPRLPGVLARLAGPLGVISLLLAVSAGCSKSWQSTTGHQGSGRDDASAGGDSASEGRAAAGSKDGSANGLAGGAGKSTRAARSNDNSSAPPPRPAMNAVAKEAFDEGMRAARQGDMAKAEDFLARATRADARAFQALAALGVFADRGGRTNQALEYYRRSLQIQPDYEVAAEGIVAIHLRRGNTQQALDFVGPLATRWVNSLGLQIVYANVLVQSAQYSQAWTVARSVLRKNERFIPALVVLVKASMTQGRVELAESIVDQGLAIDGNSAELHYWKGRLLQKTGRIQEALDELQKAVTLQPDLLEARVALGRTLLIGANYEEALRQFEAASKLAQGVAAVYVDLGEAYRATRQWAKAKAAYEQALKLRADAADVHFNLGLMYMAGSEQFPGLDKISALQAAKREFGVFRDALRSRRERVDPSEPYLRDLERQLEREQRRVAKEASRKSGEAKTTADTGGSQ